MSCTRRAFCQGVCGAAAAAALLPSCGNPVQAAPWVDAVLEGQGVGGAIVALDAFGVPDGKIHVRADLPDLARPGGAVTVRLPKEAEGDGTIALPPDLALLVVHLEDRSYVATQSSCPHAGCPLGYSTVDKLIECPCHSSAFLAAEDGSPGAKVGKVVHLPARADLLAWETSTGTDAAGRPVVTVDLRQPRVLRLPPVSGGKITIPIAAVPALAEPGGFLQATAPGLGDVLFLARVDASTILVLSAACPHMGCFVELKRGEVTCPCHLSTFDSDGTALSGPALLSGPMGTAGLLKKYAASFDGTTLTISV